MKSPAADIGESASNPAALVVAPVPPLLIPTAAESAESVICPPPAALEWLWVAFAKLAIVGVTIVGEASKTKLPVPVAPVLVTPSIVWWPVKVLAASVRAMVAEVVGNVIVVLSVPASVNVLFAVSVLPLRIVSVADVAGAVIATLFT